MTKHQMELIIISKPFILALSTYKNNKVVNSIPVCGEVYTIQVYQGNQFYLWKRLQYQEKTKDMSHLTDKYYHINLHQVHPSMGRNPVDFSGDRN